jgi:transcriptional regulator with XRE-family HTH domain
MLTRQAPPTDFKWQADNIRALRTHLGLSQTALSREIGIRQQTISEWETAMYAPRGASVTILTLLAVSSNFQFEGGASEEETSNIRPLMPEQSAPRPTQGFAPRRLADSGPVSARPEPAPAQRLTFEAAKAAQTDRRTGTYSSIHSGSRSSASLRSGEIPM